MLTALLIDEVFMIGKKHCRPAKYKQVETTPTAVFKASIWLGVSPRSSLSGMKSDSGEKGL